MLPCYTVSFDLVYHATYIFHLHTPSSYLISRFSPVATVNVLHHISHHTTLITLHVWAIIVYVCIAYHLHIPPSRSRILSPLQVLTCGHSQRTISHIILHHCYHKTRMGYNGDHCICLYSVPPTHSTFTLPYLISSPGSHLWP